jgi:hypothetical protein|tara:strand:+ start:350 stop:523 length:174 start_codon:yes stop_codon:yes gene_type:complete
MDHQLILLGVIGILLTIIGFGIALHIGSKLNKPKVELTEVQKSLKDLLIKNRKEDID